MSRRLWKLSMELERLGDAIKGTLRGFKRLNPNLKRPEMLDTIVDLSVKYGEEKEHQKKLEDWGREHKNAEKNR